ncbi:hypothetical protein PMIT1342_00853 [Prochlorococcus marinus str. MIT 1342]|nr:hypothetical protein PMIT1342_00853 [Prochlorococcus marinus str. MIT 1342]
MLRQKQIVGILQHLLPVGLRRYLESSIKFIPGILVKRDEPIVRVGEIVDFMESKKSGLVLIT